MIISVSTKGSCEAYKTKVKNKTARKWKHIYFLEKLFKNQISAKHRNARILQNINFSKTQSSAAFSCRSLDVLVVAVLSSFKLKTLADFFSTPIIKRFLLYIALKGQKEIPGLTVNENCYAIYFQKWEYSFIFSMGFRSIWWLVLCRNNTIGVYFWRNCYRDVMKGNYLN